MTQETQNTLEVELPKAEINETLLHERAFQLVTELGAAANGPLVILGDRLGLYRTLAADGPLSIADLAQKTETNERYLREWASSQAASGYITYNSDSDTFEMSPEQAALLADPDSPFMMAGGFYSLVALYTGQERMDEAFKSGEGIAWGDHNECLFCGTERFFRPGYKAHLTTEWIPALDGVEEKLIAGAKVADVGCGYGASTIVMAAAYPNSEFVGFDLHAPSIKHAREEAEKAGLKNIRFEVAKAKDYPGSDYDLVAFFDCLHDMGDPQGASEHVRQSLKADGTWLIVEPFAHDNLAENLNPVGRVYYAFSTQICTPSSLSQEVGEALGAQAGEKRLREVVEGGGFTRFRRASETPFNLILEARP